MVTRGPGAANFFIAAHCAYQDATPLVCFVGLVPFADRRRESFQEFSIDSWFGSTAKRVFTIEHASRAAETVSEALHTAASGRPGPVIVGLPEDILREHTDAPILSPRAVADPAPSGRDLEMLAERIRRSERPFLLAGGEGFGADTGRLLADWAHAQHIPVAGDWRAYDVVPGDHPAYIGWPGYGRRDSIAEALADADLFIGVGAVRGDVISEGYTAGLEAETVLIGTDAEAPQHSGRIDQFILSTPANFVASLASSTALSATDLRGSRSGSRVAELRASHERFSAPAAHQPADGAAAGDAAGAGAGRDAASSAGTSTASSSAPSTGVDLDLVFAELERQLDADRVVTYGAGNATIWGHRHLSHTVPKSLVGSRNGAMGLAVPAAVAASLVFPQRTVVAVCGDGDFLMNGQEVATLVAQGSRALFVVVDNGRYATIVDHQQRQYPGRPSGTDMANPDFVAWIRSFGGVGVRLDAKVGIADAVAEVLATETGPSLLHLVIDPATPAPSGAGW